MPTVCMPNLFGFARGDGRAKVAAFNGGKVTWDAGSLLLAHSDQAIRLVDRFAACFRAGERTLVDAPDPDITGHPWNMSSSSSAVKIVQSWSRSHRPSSSRPSPTTGSSTCFIALLR